MQADPPSEFGQSPVQSWSDNSAVGALSAFAEATERLAAVAATRALDETGVSTAEGVQLPIGDLPSHLQFARYWSERKDAYLTRARKRPCPLCSADAGDTWFRTQDGYRYDVCRDCSMVFIPHVLPMEVWNEYFAELPDARASLTAQMEAAAGGATETENRRRFGRYFDILGRLGALSAGERLLDVGTSTGLCLRVASERGLNAYGVEGLEEAVRFCTRRYPGHPVALAHAETLDPETFGGRFDLLTMWETLEHTFDPIEALRRAHASLHQTGWVALTVPNARSVQFSVLREFCFYAYGGYQGVGHINLFTPHTLARALESTGFDVVHLETEFGTDWRQVAYYLQQRFDRIYCFDNLVRRGEFTHEPGRDLSIVLNWLSPALTALENALSAGPIVLAVARRRPE